MRTGILLTIFTILSSTLSGQDLYSEIANSEDHTLFLELLEFTDLDSLLINDNYYSVFAPNFYSLGTPSGEPTVYLSEAINSSDLYTDLDNG